MNQDFIVLKNIYDNVEPQTPKEISNTTKILNPVVRKHCKYWLELGVIKKSKMPLQSHRTEYFTTDALIKKWMLSMKAEKRKNYLQEEYIAEEVLECIWTVGEEQGKTDHVS